MDGKKVIVLSKLEILQPLKKNFPEAEFTVRKSLENIEEEGDSFIALESVEGLPEPVIIDDWDSIGTCGCSEIPITLKMLVKLNVLGKVTLVRIPAGFSRTRALAETSEILSGILRE